MDTPLTRRIDDLVNSIVDERGEHWFNTAKRYPAISEDAFLYFIPHHSLTEGRTLKSHGKHFHAQPKRQNSKGEWLGRGWPGTAYHGGGSAKHGSVIAWPFTNITYHAGYKANRRAVGWLVEGNFNKRSPTEHEYELALAGKIFCDIHLVCRLLITYHDEEMEGRTCPGKYFDKEKFERLEQQYYIDKNTIPEDEPETETTPQPEPEKPQPETEDPADYPGAEPKGCLTFLKNVLK